MAGNAFKNPQRIADEALRRLENNMILAGLINRQYSSEFAGKGVNGKTGVTIEIRTPAYYEGREGDEVQVEGITDPTIPFTVDTRRGVDLGYSTQEEAMDLRDYSEQVLEPATARIATMIDQKVWSVAYLGLSQNVGTPGTLPNSVDTYIDAGVVLTDASVPQKGRNAVISPKMEGALVKGEKIRFNPTTDISNMYRNGRMGHAAGFDFYTAQGVKSHTFGAQGGTGQVAGAGQSGHFLSTTNWTPSVTGLLKRGDPFTIQGVGAVNKNTRDFTGSPRQFSAAADVNSDGGGNALIPLTEEIVLAGPYRNVTNAPGNNAPLTLVGAAGTVSPQGLAFHRDFMTLASVDLYIPKGVDLSGRASSKQAGISIRFIRFYDGIKDRLITRLDVFFGVKVIRPEMGVRIHG